MDFIDIRDLRFVSFVTSFSRSNEIRIPINYTFLCDQSRRRSSGFALITVLLNEPEKGAPLHSFLCIFSIHDIHDFFHFLR